MKLCARKDVPLEETWDLGLIYAEEKQMWEELERTKNAVKALAEAYAGKLCTAEKIVNCLDDAEPIHAAIGRLWNYAGLALEADYTDNALRERSEKVGDEITRMESEMAFIDSEILLAPEEELKSAVGMAKGSACAMVRGKPSKITPGMSLPLLSSVEASMSMMSESGTSFPSLM